MNRHFFSFLNTVNPQASISLSGKANLSLREILHIALNNAEVKLELSDASKKAIKACHDGMIEQVETGLPIYGTNSSFGEQASRLRISEQAENRIKSAKEISESILFTDVSVGPALPDELVRAAMLIRANMLLQGVSAVKQDDIEIFLSFLNHKITPIVGAYGSLGASGDLAQNCRILSAAMHKAHVKVNVTTEKDIKLEKQNAKETLEELNIPKLELEPKAGLGLVNGDNFSTAAAIL